MVILQHSHQRITHQADSAQPAAVCSAGIELAPCKERTPQCILEATRDDGLTLSTRAVVDATRVKACTSFGAKGQLFWTKLLEDKELVQEISRKNCL